MTLWTKISRVERRIKANSTYPLASQKDNQRLDIRGIMIKRYELGIDGLSDSSIRAILGYGYDRFAIDQMKKRKLIGSEKFQKLKNMEMLGLTFEYIVYSHFRLEIPEENILLIAKLLEVAYVPLVDGVSLE